MRKFLPYAAVVAFILLVVGLMAGFVSAIKPHAGVGTAGPDVVMEVLDPSLEQFAPAWQQEIARRFHHSVGILVHGGDFVQGEWIVEGNYASGQHVQHTADVVAHYRAMFPDRTIVLLACNPGHLNLGIPGVYYAHSSVWCVPDRAMTANDFSPFGRAKLVKGGASTQPSTEPSTQPTTEPAAPDPSPVSAPEIIPVPIFLPAVQTRWQEDPDVVGNIFEFYAD